MENYAQRILTGFQQRLCRDSPSAEHIVGMENRLIVEVDVGKRVQPIEHQINMVVPDRRRIDLKCSLVFPVGQSDSLQAEFVIPIKWVRDEIVVQKVGVYHARNLRRMPLLDGGIVRVSGGAGLA